MDASPRECGACTACCTVLGVPELGKPRHLRCTHLGAKGCRVYADRPGSCRTFACQWLRGVLEADGGVDPELRPDACGVIFDYHPDSAFGELFTAWELRPGAARRGRAVSVVDELSEHFLVAIVTPPPEGGEGDGERRFVGPEHRVRQASDRMWTRGPDPAGLPSARGRGG